MFVSAPPTVVGGAHNSPIANATIILKSGVLLPLGRAIAITYRVFVNQENSALPNLALTLTLT